MNDLLINQPAGMGDILFCQKILWEYSRRYEHLYWPIADSMRDVLGYLVVPENLKWEQPTSSCQVLDLQNASKKMHSKSFMLAKYQLATLHADNWQEYVLIKRNFSNEKELKKLVCPALSEYTLVCEMFASPPDIHRIKIEQSTKYPRVDIRMIDGYSLFDWIRIIIDASEIIIVDTVFTYLADRYAKTNDLFLYPRKPFHDKVVTKELWSLPWRYVE